MDENRLLLSRIDDLIYKSYINESEGLGFLNELEASVAHKYLNNLRVEHTFFGGYPQADRVYLYLSDNENISEDICALCVKFRPGDVINHRDILGALMGLGIVRECVGDIVVSDCKAIVFVRREISDYILHNLDSVGRYSVSVDVFSDSPDLLKKQMTGLEVLLTSMRIDNFVSSVCRCSRQQANDYINNDRVFMNYSCVSKTSKTISSGDTISIRGFGKYKIGEVLRNTKSGRFVLSVLQYK